jgi:prepilin signal peptidase PulO-like enzyme (type II secretory pathway)
MAYMDVLTLSLTGESAMLLHFPPELVLATELGAGASRLLILLCVLPIVTYCDLRRRVIPDALTLIVFAAAAVVQCVGQLWTHTAVWWRVVLAAAAGPGVLLVARAAACGGVGWGDVKLSLALGVLAGPQATLAGLGLGATLALATVGLGALIDGVDVSSEAGVPFGPYMVAGVILAIELEVYNVL